MSTTLNSAPSVPAWPLRTKLLIEESTPGQEGFSLPEAQAKPTAFSKTGNERPLEEIKLPQMSELAVVRHFTRLSQLNYSIDGGFYPLGSCTMKYNPRINELTSSDSRFSRLHPLTPDDYAQGALELMFRLEKSLCEISGFERVTLQPGAGAQGEYTGLQMIKKCLASRGHQNKNKILIPESAHGTNGATATLCGFEVISLKANDRGLLNIEEIEQHCKVGNVAGLMITNPNTVGLFEENIKKIADLIHQYGGLVYCDGANFNAMLGITRPGDAGIDVMHFNMHKTFTTPHGGGGPGCGGAGVSKTLVPFLPSPTVELKESGSQAKYLLKFDNPQSIGKVKDFYGHFLMMVRAYTYIRELGPEGVLKAGQDAVLNANYIRTKLKPYYDIAFDRPCMHEVVFTDKKQISNGVKTLDIAKRLIDKGFHPPTVYFPLIVSGALMIEPTETEDLSTLDNFINAMIEISQEAAEAGGYEKYFAGAPRTMPYSKVNETQAAKELKLTWST